MFAIDLSGKTTTPMYVCRTQTVTERNNKIFQPTNPSPRFSVQTEVPL